MSNNKDLEVLQELDAALSADLTSAAAAVRIDDPIIAIEDSLAAFVQSSFRCVEENRTFEKLIQKAIESRLPEASFDQLIHLYNSASETNANQAVRLITPFAAPAMEMRNGDRDKIEFKEEAGDIVYNKASKDVLQGLTALNQLLTITTKIAANNTITAAPIEDTVYDSPDPLAASEEVIISPEDIIE